MHVVRSGIRGLAGVSLIALGLAATPAFAAPGDTAATAGVSASGPILSGRIYDATGVALPGARIVVEGTGVQATTNLQGEFSIVTPEAPGDITSFSTAALKLLKNENASDFSCKK